MSKTVLCAFTELVKHTYVTSFLCFKITFFIFRINIENFDRVVSLLPDYPSPVLNCSTFNDLPELEADVEEPGLFRN